MLGIYIYGFAFLDLRNYITTALLSEFRQRTKGQLSLKFMEQYKYEAREKIKIEV
jgi:hypothetical protein